MMLDTTLRDHLTIVAQLPDFVLGKLDETSLRRVSRHLEVCPTCRHELDHAMDVLGLLAVTPPPPARVRGAILQRATTEGGGARRENAMPESAVAEPDAPSGAGRWRTSLRSGRRGAPIGPPVPRWGFVAATAVILISGLAGWSFQQLNDNPIVADDSVTALVDEATIAYPLEDSDLSIPATGVVFAAPHEREVYLVANGLPVLPHDQRYQVWLFTTDDQQESAGLLTVEADGDLRAMLQTPAPFANYIGVALTAEPATGSAFPTSDLVLGGSLPPAVAVLPPGSA